MGKTTGPATFVLVHGAWAGGWIWMRVADRLAAHGHRVFAPTLSGLGERSHLADCNITLSTHVTDIVNEISWKDLEQIVLVGFSYGGLVVTGVAEQVFERIASIVYVDAFVPADGQSFADMTGFHPTSTMVVRPPTADGVYRNDADRLRMDRKTTPQPAATWTEKLHVTGAYQRVPRKTYVQAMGWKGPFDASAAVARADPGWTVHELPCPHDIPNHMPDELTAILESAI